MIVPDRKRAKGELLPLMDVIFLLMTLFIFMIVQMRPDLGMSVDLPEVGESEAKDNLNKKKKQVWISIDADEKVYINKKIVGDTVMPSKMAAMVVALAGAEPKKIQVIFKGDQKADFGRVMEVFNALRALGCVDVLFDVNKGEKTR